MGKLEISRMDSLFLLLKEACQDFYNTCLQEDLQHKLEQPDVASIDATRQRCLACKHCALVKVPTPFDTTCTSKRISKNFGGISLAWVVAIKNFSFLIKKHYDVTFIGNIHHEINSRIKEAELICSNSEVIKGSWSRIDHNEDILQYLASASLSTPLKWSEVPTLCPLYLDTVHEKK